MRLLFTPHSWLILVVILATMAKAQVNPVYQEIQKNRKAITKGRREVKPGYTIVESFVDQGYDDSTLARLKTVVGVDMEKLWEINLAVDWNTKLRAALADCIIIGTVTRKEYPLEAAENSHPFLTIAHLKVEEFFRNDFGVSGSDLQVMIHSGPVEGATYRTQMGEDTLVVGGRYLLFLTARGLLGEAELNYKKYYQELIRDPIVHFAIVAKVGGEYRIQNGNLVNNLKSWNLQETKDEIKEVVDVIRTKFDCNTDVLKITEEYLGRLSKRQMTHFLLTFRSNCEDNAEYSEWSNELLFYTALQQPQLLLGVLSEDSGFDTKKIYSEFESPIHGGINVDSTYEAVKSMKYFTAQRDSVLHHMKMAILKNSMH